MHKKICFSVLVVFFLLISIHAQTTKIHPYLEARLQKLGAGEKIAVIVEMKEQIKIDEIVMEMAGGDRRQKARAVVASLRDLAERNQGPLRQFLKKHKTTTLITRTSIDDILLLLGLDSDENTFSDTCLRTRT